MTRDLKSALQNGFTKIQIAPFPFDNTIIVDDHRHETRRDDPPVAPTQRAPSGMISSTIPKIGSRTNIIFTTRNTGPICTTIIPQSTQSEEEPNF